MAVCGATGAAGGLRATVGANEVDAEDTSEGAIVVGGVKNEPSSSVSRKSLESLCLINHEFEYTRRT